MTKTWHHHNRTVSYSRYKFCGVLRGSYSSADLYIIYIYIYIYIYGANSVYIYIYIYIYIIIHRQICFVLSELFSVARQARFLKLGSKPGWLKRQSKILSLSHEGTSPSQRNWNAYVSHLLLFTYIRLMATESSIHMKSLALR